jgi:hypothetical protein
MSIADRLFPRLHHVGWSFGDMAFRGPDTSPNVWLVAGTRGEHTISAQGQTQTEAWEEACRLARQIRRERRSGDEP